MALFDNITAYYKFDKNHYLQKDSGPYANHGTKYGNVSITSSGIANVGNAAVFTAGAGNYIHVPMHHFNEVWKTCTLGLVLKVNSYATGGCVMTKTDANTTISAGFRVDSSNQLYYSEGGANKFTLTSWVPADDLYHWIMISTDANGANPTMTLFIDGVNRGTALTGYFGWSTNHNVRFGASEQSFFAGSGSNAAAVSIAEAAIWNSETSLSDHQAWYNNRNGYSLPQGTITLDEIGNHRVIQRDKDGSNTKTIVRGGDYTTGTPNSIEYAVYDHTTTTTLVQDWTPATKLSLNTDTKEWSAELNLPQHTNWCRYKVRSKNSAGTVLETGELSHGKVGVGAVFLGAGQSNMVHMYDWYTGTFTNAKVGIHFDSLWSRTVNYDGASWDYIGQGANMLLDKLQVGYNCPVGLIAAGVAGSGLVTSSGSGYWLDTSSSSPYGLCLTRIASGGGDFEGILWHQGESDCSSGNSKASYMTGLDTLYSRLRTYIGRTQDEVSFGIGSVGPLNDGSTAANISAIRTAQQKWPHKTTNAYYLGSNIDVTLQDQYHYATGSYTRIGRRWAQSVLYHHGLAEFPGGGPYVRWGWWLASDTKIRLIVDKSFMTALEEIDGTTDGAALTGFEVSDDNFSTTETITVTAFSGGNTIVLTVPTLLTGAAVKVRYQYAAVPTVTNPVYGNLNPQGDTLAFPLRSISEALSIPEVTVAPTDPESPLIPVTEAIIYYPRT